MNHLKNLFVISISLLILCFGTTSVFVQEQKATDTDKPNFRDVRFLLVKIYSDGKLSLNDSPIDGTACLRAKLLETFQLRLDNGVYSEEMWNRNDLPDNERVAKEVWILAASNLSSENVAAVVEDVRLAGASPIKMLTGASYQKLLDEPLFTPQNLISPTKSKVKVRRNKTKSQ